MKIVLSILIVLLVGVVGFGQTKRNKKNTRTKSTVQKISKTSQSSNEKKSDNLSKTEWIIYREPKDIVLLYNPSTIVKNGNLVKVWTKRIVKNDNYYELRLQEIDCVNHQYRLINFNAYNQDGSLIKSVVPDQSVVSASDIIPDSVTQTLEKTVCKVIK